MTCRIENFSEMDKQEYGNKRMKNEKVRDNFNGG